MRTVDTNEYVSLLKELTHQGKEVSLLISGNSMFPFLIHQRDYICFRRPDRKLRKGDMVFYQRKNGQYIMHRICGVKPDGYYMVGDAQQLIEGPIQESQIFGLVTKVKRKGKWIGPENFWWKFFRYVWIRLIPFRHMLMRLYGVKGLNT